jgi:WhiB family redox-sensing transcriptional regulator
MLLAEMPILAPLTVPCQDEAPDLFFGPSQADVDLAKVVCHGCPVRQACLDGALERREPWGVWGGELFVDGAVVPRKRPRGRPPKQLHQVTGRRGRHRPPPRIGA